MEDSQGRSCIYKTPMFGLLANGQVTTTDVKDTKATTLKRINYSMIEQVSIVVTDEWLGYRNLDKTYQHEVLNHNTHQYVSNGYHTNSIEGFWSLLKIGIFGIYNSVSPKHLERYCDEFSYRYNTRSITDTERFNVTFGQTDGRLTYKMLIRN